jgi:hypothetical protein
MGPEFWQTGFGHRFFEGDVPAIRSSLDTIATALVDLTRAVNRLADAEERKRDDAARCSLLDKHDDVTVTRF